MGQTYVSKLISESEILGMPRNIVNIHFITIIFTKWIQNQ
jgi:hypothetical protein